MEEVNNFQQEPDETLYQACDEVVRKATSRFDRIYYMLKKIASMIKDEIKATINTHCSIILEDALPPKEKKPGSFTLPCTINNMRFEKALADLGANVSDYSTFTNVDFAVVDNMDAYRDKDIGDVIVGKLFCRYACVEARRFDGFITIGDGNDSVTYQTAHSHPRFKHISNEQCNKIRPLLK
nr:hypothetical protein [Tanacetum cinerariifolium]